MSRSCLWRSCWAKLTLIKQLHAEGKFAFESFNLASLIFKGLQILLKFAHALLFDSTVVVVVVAVLVVALVLGAWDVPKVRSAGDPMASESSYTGFAKPSLQLRLNPKEISAFQKRSQQTRESFL
jgi:hypothetical protein